MCLAVIAINARPGLPLLLAANRDEFHQRPAAAAGPWPGHPDVIAGRDLAGGGTWLGITRQGRYALLTNYRDPAYVLPDAPSRGELVLQYLTGQASPADYLAQVLAHGERYNGFNLIVGNADGAWYGGNRAAEPRPQRLADGVHGLSNHLLDTPWPKLTRTRDAVADLLASDPAPAPAALFAVLGDRRGAPDEALPDTGVGIERERMLASPFIVSPTYGTRCSTVIMGTPGAGLRLLELRFDAAGDAIGDSAYTT